MDFNWKRLLILGGILLILQCVFGIPPLLAVVVYALFVLCWIIILAIWRVVSDGFSAVWPDIKLKWIMFDFEDWKEERKKKKANRTKSEIFFDRFILISTCIVAVISVGLLLPIMPHWSMVVIPPIGFWCVCKITYVVLKFIERISK